MCWICKFTFFQISDWKNEKEEMSPGRNVVAFNKDDLLNVDPAETDYLLGKLRFNYQNIPIW